MSVNHSMDFAISLVLDCNENSANGFLPMVTHAHLWNFCQPPSPPPSPLYYCSIVSWSSTAVTGKTATPNFSCTTGQLQIKELGYFAQVNTPTRSSGSAKWSSILSCFSTHGDTILSTQSSSDTSLRAESMPWLQQAHPQSQCDVGERWKSPTNAGLLGSGFLICLSNRSFQI